MGRRPQNLLGVTITEAARQLGLSDAAIHKAIKAGRAEKLADGSVDVEAVRTGMGLTANPFRGGQRQAGVFGTMQTGATVDASPRILPPNAPAEGGPAPSALISARTDYETTRAARERLQLARDLGELAEVEPMKQAVFDAMARARGELEMLPDRLTPLVAPESDPAAVYALIESEVARLCRALAADLELAAARAPAQVVQ